MADSVKPFVRGGLPQFVLFGDSITELSFEAATSGWGAMLADHYRRHADVINRGFSGYNTRWCRLMLDDVFPTPPPATTPRLVTVFLGANDAALAEVSSRQHVPLDEYEANLVAIVAHVRRQAAEAASPVDVVIIGPPPVDHAARLEHQLAKYGDKATGVLERTNDNTGKYAEVCVKVGRELGVPVVDVYTELQAARPGSWEAFLCDGLHLSAEGNAAVFGLLVAAINAHLPHLSKAALSIHFPEHTDVDDTNPTASLLPPTK